MLSTHAGDNRFRRTTGEGPSRGRRSIRNRAHGHPKEGGHWPGQIRLASTEGGPITARPECEARCSCRNRAPSRSSRRRRQTRSCDGPTLGTSQQICGQRLRSRTGRCHGSLHRGRRARELRRLLGVGYRRAQRDPLSAAVETSGLPLCGSSTSLDTAHVSTGVRLREAIVWYFN
jgi:hypothetical protein